MLSAMPIRTVLDPVVRVIVALACLSTVYLYLYPLFHACAFPATDGSAVSAFRSLLLQSLPHPPPPPHTLAALAPFRLLVLADPQLEGDSSLPKAEEALALAELCVDDIPRSLQAARKRLDLFGNDYYLAHIFRTLKWWAKPTHVTVLGDLIGSQWVSDDEFEWRAWRFWNRVFGGGERVDDAVVDAALAGHSLPMDDEAWSGRIINIAGNHDIGYAGDVSRARLDRFERLFGPANWDVRFDYPSTSTSAPGNSSAPTLHLVVLNSLVLDTPALDEAIQHDTYDYVNDLLAHRTRPVDDASAFTLLLTHLPLHKPAGVCVDGPYSDFWGDDDGGGVYRPHGLKEQNHLSKQASESAILKALFGMSGDLNAPARGTGRPGLILTGHDHEGCDTWHYIPSNSTWAHPLDHYHYHDDANPEPDVEEGHDAMATQFQADRNNNSTNASPAHTGIREITLRSMMGDFGGNAALLSAWFDFDAHQWRYSIQMYSILGYESLALHSDGRQQAHDHGTISAAKPVYNRARGTRLTCITALVFSTLVGIGFLILAGRAHGRTTTFKLSPLSLELIPLAINFVVLIVTESNGYIHSVSLRWALFHEGKLEFNTNLRLLTFSKRNIANGIVANVVFFITLAICYGASPMILVRNTYDFYLYDGRVLWNDTNHLVSISKAPPIALGLAILIQCALSTWCLQTSTIPTWSSHPLTTLAAANDSGRLSYQRGRCMMSVHDRVLPATPTAPRPRQLSPYSASPHILHILLAVFVVLCALAIWTAIIIHIGLHNFTRGSWSFIPTSAVDPNTNTNDITASMTMTVFLKFFANSPNPPGPDVVPEANMAAILVFCLAIQSFLTIGLHCAELQVLLLRDESVWRTISSASGSKAGRVYNSVTEPFKVLPNLILLLFKPVVHWMFGSSLQVDYAKGILMRVPQITYLTVTWLVFLVFVCAISFVSPKGPLPATYGHLQTMLNIADDLSDNMHWGEKDVGSSSSNTDLAF
ncbi:hypothetical protein DV737_g4189, partial [Chaetothyriales sp. CBS 132003]